LDVISKSIERMVNEVLTKQEKNAWAVILKSLAEAYTPVYAGGQTIQATYSHVGQSASTGSGTANFLLADLNNLIVRIKRINESYAGNTPIQPYSHGITDLYVSPEVKAQIRAFAYNPINTSAPGNTVNAVSSQFLSSNLRDEIYKNGGLQNIYGVNLVELIEFGTQQKYNTLFGTFAYSGSNSASVLNPTYAATTVNGVSGANWNASTYGNSGQICVGIDNTRGTFVRPVAVQAESGGTFSVLPDGQFEMYGSRVQKIGFYGFLEEGRVCLDARAVAGVLIQE
jgi:hypothetical protein